MYISTVETTNLTPSATMRENPASRNHHCQIVPCHAARRLRPNCFMRTLLHPALPINYTAAGGYGQGETYDGGRARFPSYQGIQHPTDPSRDGFLHTRPSS